MKNWTVNTIAGEIFFKGQSVLFSCNLIIEHNNYDMCVQTSPNEFFEHNGGHGLGEVEQNLPESDFSDLNKVMNSQLQDYLNNYDYTLDQFLTLPQFD